MTGTIKKLESGKYVLEKIFVQITVGRAGTLMSIGRLTVFIDSSVPQDDGSWKVRYSLEGERREGILTAAT